VKSKEDLLRAENKYGSSSSMEGDGRDDDDAREKFEDIRIWDIILDNVSSRSMHGRVGGFISWSLGVEKGGSS
jgi:hypothetical protein